ncbi:MAG TPA: phosphoribosyltransferase [Geobacterales bacterium]|nr:phosphoribosyltransferase [Geobacterales bacterium]
MDDFYVLKWTQLYKDVMKLCFKIKKDNYRPDMLVAIARGGWVIARIVSDILEIDQVTDIHVSFYTDIAKTKKEPVILEDIGKDVSKKRVLVVDDVSDTGESLLKVLEYLKAKHPLEIKTATVYIKPWTKYVPDYYIKEIAKWIIYPYEIKESIRKLWDRWSKEGLSEKEIIERLRNIGLPKWQISSALKV